MMLNFIYVFLYSILSNAISIIYTYYLLQKTKQNNNNTWWSIKSYEWLMSHLNPGSREFVAFVKYTLFIHILPHKKKLTK